MSVAAGRLRHRVTIQERVEAIDPETGAAITTWKDFATVRAAVEPLSAKEFVASQAMQSEVSARITIRYLDGLDASMRIIHMVRGNQRIYNIIGVLPDNQSGIEHITIPCGLGVNDG